MKEDLAGKEINKCDKCYNSIECIEQYIYEEKRKNCTYRYGGTNIVHARNMAHPNLEDVYKYLVR